MGLKKKYLYLKILGSFLLKSMDLKKKGINSKLWKDKFLNLLDSGDKRCGELLHEFMNCKIEKITNHKVKRKSKYSPILFCVIRNEIDKIEQFMEHYRKLGIEVFVFLENDSEDGTREYLCNQKDAIVYHSSQEYTSARRIAWLNYLLARHGQNRWCMIVDSDELITYIGSEDHPIKDMVKVAIEQQYYRIEGFMMDMYPKGELFLKQKGVSYVNYCKYFDMNTYKIKGSLNGVCITGGPRKRVLEAEVQLSKYPLFFFREQDFVASSHYMIPVEPIKKCPIWIVICHYKFINDTDLQKIKYAVKRGNYASGSKDYKQYLDEIKKNRNISFFSEDKSCELQGSESLNIIPFLKRAF